MLNHIKELFLTMMGTVMVLIGFMIIAIIGVLVMFVGYFLFWGLIGLCIAIGIWFLIWAAIQEFKES